MGNDPPLRNTEVSAKIEEGERKKKQKRKITESFI